MTGNAMEAHIVPNDQKSQGLALCQLNHDDVVLGLRGYPFFEMRYNGH